MTDNWEDDDEGHGFLGSGTPREGITDAQVARTIRALQATMQSFPDLGGWSAGDIQDASFTLFSRADVGGGEQVHSEVYGRNRTRVSYHVLCAYEEADDRRQHYIATIAFFVLARPPGGGGDGKSVLRLGVCALAPAEQKQMCVFEVVDGEERGIGTGWRVKLGDSRVPLYQKDWAIPLHDIQCKNIMAKEPGQPHTYFLAFANMSGMGRFTILHAGDGNGGDEDAGED